MITTAETKPTPELDRAARARVAAARKAHEQRAEWLRARGWVCIPPERVTDEIGAAFGGGAR